MCIGVRPDRAIPEVDTSGPNEVFDLFSTKGKPTDCKYHNSKPEIMRVGLLSATQIGHYRISRTFLLLPH